MSVVGNGAPASGATDDVPRDKQAAPTVMDGLSSSKVTGKGPITHVVIHRYLTSCSRVP
jgi:hypothetical protein